MHFQFWTNIWNWLLFLSFLCSDFSSSYFKRQRRSQLVCKKKRSFKYPPNSKNQFERVILSVYEPKLFLFMETKISGWKYYEKKVTRSIRVSGWVFFFCFSATCGNGACWHLAPANESHLKESFASLLMKFQVNEQSFDQKRSHLAKG